MNARWWWLGYALVAAMVLGAMGWFTSTVRAGQVAERRAARATFADDTARLALWRLDSRLATVIAREAGRPYVAYNAFYPAAGALDRTYDNFKPGDVIVPSPLLGLDQDEVLLHLQYASDGTVTSPQVPVGNLRQAAVPAICSPAQITRYGTRLADFSARVSRAQLDREMLANPAALSESTIARMAFACATVDQLLAQNLVLPLKESPSSAPPSPPPLPTAPPSAVAQADSASGARTPVEDMTQADLPQADTAAPPTAQILPPATTTRQPASSVQSRSGKEQAVRASSIQAMTSKTQQEANRQPEQQASQYATLFNDAARINNAVPAPEPPVAKTSVDLPPVARPAPATVLPRPQRLDAEIMRPLWLRSTRPPATVSPTSGRSADAGKDLLVLARRVRVDTTDWLQACWLDWPLIRRQLLADISDLLPEADLVPLGGSALQPHRLATLPLVLLPGDVLPDWQEPPQSSATLPMIGAWSGVLVALIAGGVLLGGALALSERRGAFVSAVTHELRTPLTTFRLYTDLLADRRVTDEVERQRCLDTLRIEADRLGHLVENVLGYARLERTPLPTAALGITALVAGMHDRLAERAGRAGLTLSTQVAAEVQALAVRGEAQAIERILVNLVDNACKYAAKVGDPRLHLEVGRRGQEIAFTVRDHGPGIAGDLLARLFTPFAKSASEAALTAPGIGLGLALSRRLARQLGGDLRCQPPAEGGAAFVLTLPRA